MTFVNKKLTTEQRREFEQRGIKNPVPHEHGNLKPLYWTIDYDMSLVGAGAFREFPD